MSKAQVGWCCSILIHSLIAFMTLYKSESNKTSNTLQVEILASPRMVTPAGKQSRISKKSEPVGSKNSLSVGARSPIAHLFNTDWRPGESGGVANSKKYTGQADRLGEDFDSAFDALTTEKYTPLMPFFAAIWNKVDRALVYPDDFVQQRIHGVVTVQIALDRTGKFTGRFLRARGEDSLLEVFVLTTLIHALRDSLPDPRLWIPYDKIAIALTFDFRLVNFQDQVEADSTHHVKNSLLFSRTAFVEPIVNQKIVKFFTRYVPPIIIIPGGFYIDFVHAVKMIKEIGKPDADDLRLRRLSEVKKQLESLVRESTTGT